MAVKHIQESMKMHDGGLATIMVYDMGDFRQQCVDKYCTLARTVGPVPKFAPGRPHPFWQTILLSLRRARLRRRGLSSSALGANTRFRPHLSTRTLENWMLLCARSRVLVVGVPDLLRPVSVLLLLIRQVLRRRRLLRRRSPLQRAGTIRASLQVLLARC